MTRIGSASHDAANERFSQEMGKLASRLLSTVCVLQLLPCHQTLRITRAMECGASDHIWGIEESLTALATIVRGNVEEYLRHWGEARSLIRVDG